MHTAIKIAKDVISDPAFGFNIGGILLFAGTGPVGLAATVGATLSVAAVNVIKTLNPAFLQKENKLTAFIKDPRTPLWLLTAAMTVVTGASFITGAPLIATAAGAIFAVADYLCAEQVGRILKQQGKAPEQNAPPQKLNALQIIGKSLKLPEPYLATGLMISGLMAGGLSALAFPLVLAGAGICIANTLKNNQEHVGHPKLFYSGAMGLFGAVGLATGNIFPALANIVSAVYMTKLEAQLTPGGAQQMLSDVKLAIQSLKHKETTEPLPEVIIDTTPAPVSMLGRIAPEFGQMTHLPAPQATAQQPEAAAAHISRRNNA